MKKGCIIAAVVVGLVGLLCAGGATFIFYWVFSVTGEAVASAETFLSLVGEGKVAEAYESSAAAMKTQQTPDAFARSVKELGLDGYASASWGSRNVHNNEATLEGSITTKSGGTLPVKVELVQESGQWRVLSVTVPRAGVAAGADKVTMPPDDELRRMATAALLEFDRGVKANDFTDFHAKASTPFRQQKSPDELKQAFHEFVEKKIDLSQIKDLAPVFEQPPAQDAEGALVLLGYYPTMPTRVNFRLRFVYEHPEWKLLGINVNTTAGE